MLLKLQTLVLLPCLVWQGRKVKKNTPRLAEATGERLGQIGQGKAISILILGDSAAAGVGVHEQAQALSGQILKTLQSEYRIEWCLEAKTGRTTSGMLKKLTDIEHKHYDVVVTSLGVNDVVGLNAPKRWAKQQKQLYAQIQQQFSPHLIVATSVPPLNLFPALPQPLAWLFGRYAKQMNQQLAKLVRQNPKMQWIEYDIEQYQKQNLTMAEDGFHPSAEIYAMWGDEVAQKIRKFFKSCL